MLIIAAVAALLICLEIYLELHRFQVTTYKIDTEKLKKSDGRLTIVFLSDLHNHVYGADNQELIRAIETAKPDYIFAGGDMLIGRKGKHSGEAAKHLMKAITRIAPVYAANGNHEQRMHEQTERYGAAFADYKEELEKADVKWLIDENTTLFWGNSKIALTGIELPMDCYRRPRKHWLQVEDIEERVGKREEDTYQILLAHHPDFARTYQKWGADLTLSGHLHGGVARLPFLGGVISPQIGLFPKYSGDCYDVDGSKIVVSKGLGTHTVNLRFWNPAELIVLHIEGKM